MSEPGPDGMPPRVRSRMVNDGPLLQGQAKDIIGSILDDPSPELDEVKRRLQRCLAAYPGAPEKALLAHLMETSQLANAGESRRPAAGLPVA